jgi:hypothetical protein
MSESSMDVHDGARPKESDGMTKSLSLYSRSNKARRLNVQKNTQKSIRRFYR